MSLQDFCFDFLLHVLNLKPTTSFGIWNKNEWFSSMQWKLDGPKIPEKPVCYNMPRYSNSFLFNSTGCVFSSRFHSLTFYLRRTICFQLSWSLSLTSELDSWLTERGISASGNEISRSSFSSFSKTIDWYFTKVSIDGDRFLNDY